MRHSILPVVTASALFSAAIAVIAAAVFLQPPLVAGSPTGGAASADVARRFYAAVNDAIATGDVSAVHRVVATHFVEQDPLPGVRPGRDGLADYLRLLHRIDPAMRLEAEAVVADGSQAVARVVVRRDDGEAVLGGALVDEPPLWGPVDVFRVVGGTIVERWGQSDALIVPRALADVALDLPAPAPRVVTIERVVLDPGRRWHSHIPGPRLFHLEEGALQVSVPARTAATVGSDPTATESPAFETAPVVTLSAGGSWVAPAGAELDLTNPSGSGARLLVVTFAVPRIPGGALSIAEALPTTPTGEILAGGLATDVGVGRATLTLTQLTLARDALLALSSGEGPNLIAVEEGALEVTTWETTWGRAWLRRGTDGMSAAINEAQVAAGDSVLLHPGNLTRVRNVGGNPAVVLILTLRPASASTPVVPDGEDAHHALAAAAFHNRWTYPASPAAAGARSADFTRDVRSGSSYEHPR